MILVNYSDSDESRQRHTVLDQKLSLTTLHTGGVPLDGEAVKIFVVRKDPNLTAEEIIAYSRTQLTSYKVPHHVEFRNDLPKTNVGKVLRQALKE